MHVVVDKLFLTDQETIEKAGATLDYVGSCNNSCGTIASGDIGLIISIGCRPFLSTSLSSCRHLSFPQFMDEPTSCLLMMWETIIPIIDFYRIEQHQAVVVHCVYGQSRSVSTIIAYLCATADEETRFTLQAAADHMKSVKPSISVNPGFLSQLFFFSNICTPSDDSSSTTYANIFKLYKLLFKDFSVDNDSCIALFNNMKTTIHNEENYAIHDKKRSHEVGPNNDDESPSKKPCSGNIPLSSLDNSSHPASSVGKRKYCCKKCKAVLFSSDCIITSSVDSSGFVQRNTDEFWQSFGVSKETSRNQLPLKGYFAIVPPLWMANNHKQTWNNQKQKDIVINCNCCNNPIGNRKRGGNYFGPFTPADLFLIQNVNVVPKGR